MVFREYPKVHRDLHWEMDLLYINIIFKIHKYTPGNTDGNDSMNPIQNTDCIY